MSRPFTEPFTEPSPMATTITPRNHTNSTPRELVPLLLEICGVPSAVVEVGTNPGEVLKEFERHCSKHTGAPLHLESVALAELPPESPAASLVLCLEGAEKIMPERALSLVQWLSNTADVVVFAAALPGQMNANYINCQATLYWCDLFEICGFRRYDILREHLLANDEIPWQLRQNVVIYARQYSAPERQLQNQYPYNFLPPEFELVHHTMITNALLFRSAWQDPIKLGALLKELPASVSKSLQHRISHIGEKLARIRYT